MLRRRAWLFFALIAGVLLLLMLAQLPRIADWSLFAFFDPGSVLKADQLITDSLRPAIDFGYTHGLASLLVAHWGFALLGRTPAAYLFMTAILEVLMAAAIARFANALRFKRRALVFLLCALPVAVMPCYLTLSHVLEATGLLWAIAEQARGRRTRALAITTACLFVKPSMAYVYGLLLVLWTLWDWRSRGETWGGLWKRTWPAAATALVLVIALAWRFGGPSLALTIVPLTGMRTYHATHFGFFLGSGLQFWSPLRHDWLYYLTNPAGLWLLTTGILAVVGVRQLIGLARRFPTPPHRRTQTLISMAIMQVAFVLAFYGWSRSWEYYSYLPILFTAAWLSGATAPREYFSTDQPVLPPSFSRLSWLKIRITILPNFRALRQLLALAASPCRSSRQSVPKPGRVACHGVAIRRSRAASVPPSSFRPPPLVATTPRRAHPWFNRCSFVALCLLALLSQIKHLEVAVSGWYWKTQTPQTAGLWAYPGQRDDWLAVQALTAGRPTLVLSNGYVPWMPPGMKMPASWFPEPGITTSPELQRVRRQATHATYVVTWNNYGQLDLWNQPAFTTIQRRFQQIRRGPWMSVWQKRVNGSPAKP